MNYLRVLTYLRRKLKAAHIFAILFLFGTIAHATPDKLTFTDSQGWPVYREFLPHSMDSSKKVEIFWARPQYEGKFPAILFIHGHQEWPKDGGGVYVRTGHLGRMAKRGYVSASISQPGYGNSDGPPDFCGPFTQDAVLVAIDFLRSKAFIDPNKIALFGYSRGAIVASMVATKDENLGAVILGAGAYDFFKWYPTRIPGINENIEREAGTSPKAFRERSAIYHAERIKAPVLILHGALDDRIPVSQAKEFAEKLKSLGKTVKLVIFPDCGHAIPVTEQYREILPFLEEHLREKK